MKYSYPIIDGENIMLDDLTLTRAKNIALVIKNHPLCIENSIQIRKREDGCEILLVTFDIEIPQFPQNGIEAFENVAIVCTKEDQNFPEVYALRNDFNRGLSHTNIRSFKYPISLCLTEQLYCEIKHRFNEYEFIDSIARWFTLTAEDKLHQEDQPLEPFFIPRGFVLIPNNFKKNINEYNCLEKIGESNIYELKVSTEDSQFHLLSFESDPQTHGFVRKDPQQLSDLGDVFNVEGKAFPIFFKNYLDNNIKDLIKNSELLRKPLAFHSVIPVKRNKLDTKPSSWQYLFFLTNNSLLELGIKCGCIGELNNNVVPLLFKKFPQEEINNISVNLLSSMPDFSLETAPLYNDIVTNGNQFTLIGVGALGSQVFELASRMAWGKWIIIDNDTLYPHNLAKHSLGRKDVGFNKAIKVAEKANSLLNCEIAKPIMSNFLEIQLEKDFIKELQQSCYIVDMSTSIAVARALARDYKELVKSPRISCFLNPNGTDLVVLAEDKKRKNRLDFLEMQYYRCLINDRNLQSHLKYEDSLRVRYNRNSCREITSKINQTDVSLHASICAKAIKQISEAGQSAISIWHINNDTLDVRRLNFTPSQWKRYDKDNWKIYIDNWLIEKMQSLRKTKLPNETGGILIGSYDSLRKIIYICDTISAPDDSIEHHTSFIRGKNKLIDHYNECVKAADNQVHYIGEWHSHPVEYSTSPSQDDNNLYSYLHSEMSKQGLPVIMSILGDNDCNIIFKENSYEI